MCRNREFSGGRHQGEFGREEKREIWGAIVAAAIGAAGTIGGSALASQGAKRAAASAGNIHTQTIPLPPYADALNRYTARLIAANANQVAPSFGQWEQSGGTATFPMQSTGFTPSEMVSLGMVDKQGRPIPFGSAGESRLTPDQLLFLGRKRIQDAKAAHQPDPMDPVSRYERLTNILNMLHGETQTPQRQKREGTVSGKLGKVKSTLGIT